LAGESLIVAACVAGTAAWHGFERLHRGSEVGRSGFYSGGRVPLCQEAECQRIAYYVAPGLFVTQAWAEHPDLGGRRGIEVGTFGNMEQAKQACEADAQRRLRREEGPGPVYVRIAPRRQ
jgi:hypothetical protein